MTAQPLGRPVGSNGDVSRQRIITAAMRSVATLGYSRTTMREIARLAGMTSGSIYHYFPNKSELMAAAASDMAETVGPRLVAAAASADDPMEKLLAVFDECERLNQDYPDAAKFDRTLRVESPPTSHRGALVSTLLDELCNVVVPIVQLFHDRGGLAAEVDVDSTTTAILTVMRGVSEYPPMAPPSDHLPTVRALRMLLAGALFNYDKLGD